MVLQTINPYTQEKLNTYKAISLEEANFKVEKAYESYFVWRHEPVEQRLPIIKQIAINLRKEKEKLAQIMALEMGKPLTQGLREIEKCAFLCDYYSCHGAEFLKDDVIKTEASKSYITYQPLGIILAIMPWNFPFWQVFRAIIPALLCGNGVILKHASNVCECALAIQTLLGDSGLPSHLFQILFMPGESVLPLMENKYIKGITFTGSTEVGKQIASKAGSLIKKTVLELGGSDPFIVCDDADLTYAAQAYTESRLQNSGQTCIAAKRCIIVKKHFHTFQELLIESFRKQGMGDPFNSETIIGPMAQKNLRDALHEQVQKTLFKGAKCLLGGTILKEKGFFYPPTLLSCINKDTPAYQEELFGPVGTLILANDEEEAISIANDTSFGLGASVFTQDIEKGEHIASKLLQAGSCCVNSIVKSDPRLPFGGINESGYGRELSHIGLKEFVNIKTVVIK